MQPPRDRLTVKERVVATLVWEGLTNRDIADRIHTSEQVVKNHLRSACDKLVVWSRLELALYVASHGGASWEGSLLTVGGPLDPAVPADTGRSVKGDATALGNSIGGMPL